MHGPFYRVVEIGCRDINGGVRDLFPHAVYTGIDIRPGPGVDVVADGATYKPMSEVDCVVCCEVLEHTPDAELIVRNCANILDKGGCLIITCAGEGRDPHSAIDLDPIRPDEYYANIGEFELGFWLSGLLSTLTTYRPPGYTDLYAVGIK